MFKSVVVLVLLTCIVHEGFAQKDTLDTAEIKDTVYEHLPKRAALWALFPGAGQFYNEVGYRKIPQKKNRAWWKIPIVWGALGTCGYFWYDNYSNAKGLKEEILYRREFGDSLVGNPKYVNYTSESDLIFGFNEFNGVRYEGFNTHAKRRDLFLFASIGVYALQMIEAFVDAHFVTFDVSEDLSMRVFPTMMNRNTLGLSFHFSFKAPSSALTTQQHFSRF